MLSWPWPISIKNGVWGKKRHSDGNGKQLSPANRGHLPACQISLTMSRWSLEIRRGNHAHLSEADEPSKGSRLEMEPPVRNPNAYSAEGAAPQADETKTTLWVSHKSQLQGPLGESKWLKQLVWPSRRYLSKKMRLVQLAPRRTRSSYSLRTHPREKNPASYSECSPKPKHGPPLLLPLIPSFCIRFFKTILSRMSERSVKALSHKSRVVP